jgi:hypothetical protein
MIGHVKVFKEEVQLIKLRKVELGVLVHTCNPHTLEAETEESQVQSQIEQFSKTLSPKRRCNSVVEHVLHKLNSNR